MHDRIIVCTWRVLPIGGVSAKIEAAIAAGIKNIIVPQTNIKI